MFNSQCSILIRKEKRPHVGEHPLRMRIEHGELSIGQIPTSCGRLPESFSKVNSTQ
jgi:hypothetical protein